MPPLRTACYGHIRDLLRVVTSAGTEAEGSAVPLYEVKRVAEFVSGKLLPLAAHFSLLTTHHSLLSSHYSVLTTQFSLLSSHYSLLTTHCSPLTIHYSGKLCRAMLEAGKQHEAYDAFRRHTHLFKPLIHATPDREPPPGAPPASVAAAGHLHWGWLGNLQRTNTDPVPNPNRSPNPSPNSNPNPQPYPGKQQRSFAKHLDSISDAREAVAASGAPRPPPPPASQYAEPGYYYQVAASCALARRQCAEQLVAQGVGPQSAVTIEGRPWCSTR